MRASAEKIRNALLLGALGLSSCTVNFVRQPKEPQVLHEQIEYFKWLYGKGFYRTEPELMKGAALRLFNLRPPRDEPEPEIWSRLEQLLLKLEHVIEQEAKKPSPPPEPHRP